MLPPGLKQVQNGLQLMRGVGRTLPAAGRHPSRSAVKPLHWEGSPRRQELMECDRREAVGGVCQQFETCSLDARFSIGGNMLGVLVGGSRAVG